MCAGQNDLQVEPVAVLGTEALRLLAGAGAAVAGVQVEGGDDGIVAEGDLLALVAVAAEGCQGSRATALTVLQEAQAGG